MGSGDWSAEGFRQLLRKSCAPGEGGGWRVGRRDGRNGMGGRERVGLLSHIDTEPNRRSAILAIHIPLNVA